VALVLDTGVLYALLDVGDPDNQASLEVLAAHVERLVIPAPVLPELDHMLRSRGAGEAMDWVLEDVCRGVFVVEDLQRDDYLRVSRLCEKYADAKVGFVDAAVLATVERLGERKLATLDRRHFSVLRPRHVEALELLPA
jgi:predicted nucleic acid-binding protein